MASITGSFTGTGVSLTGLGHIADAIIGGTFVATVALEVAIPLASNGSDLWVAVATLTAPGMMTLPNGAFGAQVRKWRLNCSAFTSGTINYGLGASQSEDMIDLV